MTQNNLGAAYRNLPGATVVDDYSEDSVFVRAGGADITANADAFHYIYQPLVGDGRMIARVAQLLTDLGNDRFAVRKEATDELSRMGNIVEPLLRKELEAPSSSEVCSGA